MRSCPVRQVPCELPRGANLLVGFDEAGFNSRRSYLRGYSGLSLLKVEALAQRLVGHPLRHHPPQGAVLVATADSVVPVVQNRIIMWHNRRGDSVVGRLASAGGLIGFVSFLVSARFHTDLKRNRFRTTRILCHHGSPDRRTATGSAMVRTPRRSPNEPPLTCRSSSSESPSSHNRWRDRQPELDRSCLTTRRGEPARSTKPDSGQSECS